MKRKALAITLAAAMAMGTCAVTASAADGDKYTIGICQLVQHEALDAATQGFKDEVTKELGEDAVTFDEQNAQGDSNTCSTIINSFVSNNVDLILANATPALQAAAAGTSDIPILGTSVTEYGVALGLDDFDGTVGGNISGTADLAPLDQQAAMLNELFPDAKNVGLLYCSAEANSQPPFATFLKSVSIWDIPSTSRPESTSRTRKAIMSRRTNGQFSRIPMSLSLTSRPLTLCRKSVGMSDATQTAGAKQLPSRACSIAPIAVARCMSTAPTTASVFLNIPAPNTAKSQLESSARHSTVSMKMWYCPLFQKC